MAAATIPRKTYGKIILTLENCLLPAERFSITPSEKDGLNSEVEKGLRILGCELIQTAGILLKLPQVAMATGQVLFQRFYYSKSLVKHNYEVVAMGCLCLASKIEENPRRMRDVINVFHHIRQVRNGKIIQPLVLDQNYIYLKTQVIKCERRVLKELGFCVHVKHPHKIIVMYLQVLDCQNNRQLAQTAWNYMNDSLRSDVFVKYNPETIAVACIYLSARQFKIPLPNRPPWYGVFNVTEAEIQDISYTILRLYSKEKPNQDKLEKAVEELKKKIEDTKNKAKTIPVTTTPLKGGNFSPNSRSSRSNSPAKNDRSPDVKREKGRDGPRNLKSPKRDANHASRKNSSRGSSRSRSDSPSSPRRKTKKNPRSPSRGYPNKRRSNSRSRSPIRSRPPHHHKNKHRSKSSLSVSRSYSPRRNNAKKLRKEKRFKSGPRVRNNKPHKIRNRDRENGRPRARSQERSRR